MENRGRVPTFLFLLLLVVARNGALAFLSPKDVVSTRGPGSRSFSPQERMKYSSQLFMWRQDDELQGSDRLKACVPYILPLLDGDQFGRYIYQRIPPLGTINELFFEPLVNIYHKIPFLGVGLFVALTLGTRFNTDMNRNVRFNAQQAALIDVALIFPELFGSSIADQPIPRSIMEPCTNFVWYAYMSACIYCIYSNLRGKKPDQLPYISGSADMMVGPF